MIAYIRIIFCLIGLVTPLYASEQISIISQMNNILVARTNTIPFGPNSKPEVGYEEECERRLVQPSLKSAQMILVRVGT